MLLVVTTVMLGPPGIDAPRAMASERMTTDDAVTQARALFRRGLARFETFDYTGAIELWTEAYATLPISSDTQDIRIALVYNIARARMEAYRIDHNSNHLRQAQLLLGRYLQEVEALEIASDNLEELAKIYDKLREIETLLGSGKETDDEVVAGPQTLPLPGDDKPQSRDKRSMPPAVIAGAVLGAVGVGMSGVMIAGLVRGKQIRGDYEHIDADREALRADGRRMNGLAIGAGVAAGVFLATGAALIVWGMKKSKRQSAMVRPWGNGLAFEIPLGF